MWAFCLGQNDSQVPAPDIWVNLAKKKKWGKQKQLLDLCSLTFCVDVATVKQVDQQFQCVSNNQTAKWWEKHFSGGVNNWNQWCFPSASGLQSLLNFKCHIFGNNLRVRCECIFVCSFVLLARAYHLWGWTDETGVRTLFLGRQSLTCTVNDFSTSFGVIDNHNERVGWELLAHFFKVQWMAEKVRTSPRSCCAVHVFHLCSNVKRSALGQSNDGFPSWQLPLFQRSTRDEKGGGGGWDCV